MTQMVDQIASQGGNIPISGADRGERARAAIRRRPGGQPGNQNRVIHGRYSGAYKAARKLSRAQLKVLCQLGHFTGDLPGRNRTRMLRPDQVALLAEHDPVLLQAAEEVNLRGVKFFLPAS